MLKTDWKQNFILLGFSLLMHEVLTLPTMFFIGVGLLLVGLNIKVPKLARNVMALGVFASYWVTYGKIIDPEVGLNFLTSIVVLKILEKEAVRDRYMIFFGLILLISAGSLFEKTLTYVFFFSVSFLLLIGDFYSSLGQKWKFKDIALAVAWVIPLTFFMFFLVPRVLNPIPFNQGKTAPGEIGHTPDVNISSIDSLAPNQTPAFQVLVNKSLTQQDLYWRGNTLSYNDGWNWVQMPQDREEPIPLLGARPGRLEVKQNFRLYGRSDYFFTLDFPRVISYERDIYGLGKMRTHAQKRWRWIPRYEVISHPQARIQDSEGSQQYLQVPLPKKDKLQISETFKGKTFPEIESAIRDYFIKEKFSYSLSPGRSLNFKEFMNNKVGFCSHYASAVALILRIKGIPTRLVSGFMGGNYNRFASFYLISQNDAHVWVEALVDNEWKRLDPTEWIAPDRVRLGGEAFIESVGTGGLRGTSFLRLPRMFQDLKMWFGQWDFLFYQWLEEMDYHTQESWLSRLKFKRQWLFSIIPLILVIFMGMYMWFLKKHYDKKEISPYQEVWNLFYKKLQKRGISLSKNSLGESELVWHELTGPEKERLQMIWKELIAVSFQKNEESLDEIRKKIRKL
ncbi:MAG: DUF3488 and transglutaminase-like domain-containing protein [Bacteriovoracaceae bacterium]|nr:DUF3488 and transglutaminase-like domain-containing protein [Bacteriovoracaceae bacterium]